MSDKKQVDPAVSEAARILGRKGGLARETVTGFHLLSERKRKAMARTGAKARWALLTPEERSAEMGRRRREGLAKKKAEAGKGKAK